MNLDGYEYHSFMLRMWRVKEKGLWVWRSSIQSTESGNVQGFSEPQQLIACLKEMLASDSDQTRSAQGSPTTIFTIHET